jgi:GINS complex subunit 1
LKRLRWQLGQLAEMPDCVRINMSDDEVQWFTRYAANLGLYMRRLNAGTGLDLTVGYKPPKQLYVQVRCLIEYGDYDLDDGTTVVLSRGSTHFLQRSQCEKLIQTGVLEQIS